MPNDAGTMARLRMPSVSEPEYAYREMILPLTPAQTRDFLRALDIIAAVAEQMPKERRNAVISELADVGRFARDAGW